jgi:hypothetical protein
MEKMPAGKIPFINRSDCTDCESCISLLPMIFKRNNETGCIEIAELPEYPEDAVESVIAMCPGDCVGWESP